MLIYSLRIQTLIKLTMTLFELFCKHSNLYQRILDLTQEISNFLIKKRLFPLKFKMRLIFSRLTKLSFFLFYPSYFLFFYMLKIWKRIEKEKEINITKLVAIMIYIHIMRAVKVSTPYHYKGSSILRFSLSFC